MRILQVGESVFHLRFMPGGRLLVGVVSAERIVHFDVLTLADGRRVRLPLPQFTIEGWWHSGHGNLAAVHPSGEWCYFAWGGRLYSFRTAEGTRRPVPDGIPVRQVVIAPDGDRLLTVGFTPGGTRLSGFKVTEPGDAIVWSRDVPPDFQHAAGFLPDGERFVTVGKEVQVHTFATNEVLAATRYPTYNANQPQVSPDGRHLGVIGYSCMYLYDLAALGKPRRIGGTRSCGDFESFAFHPGGTRLAVIHGGPTLVKLYDLATLKLVFKFNWKVGALGCVAFSPDGMLGAVGTQDGRIVLWDVDE
jgi:WD40 repeat protein